MAYRDFTKVTICDQYVTVFFSCGILVQRLENNVHLICLCNFCPEVLIYNQVLSLRNPPLRAISPSSGRTFLSTEFPCDLRGSVSLSSQAFSKC